ncbi:MAG TPA: hypothetical protein VFW74_00710 [Acidimicrobiia bacterium]|nr:hypothetical protein [Acidimicrobiia bacterium]
MSTSRAVSMVIVVALAVVLGACSGGSAKAHTTKPARINSSVALKLTTTNVESAGPAVAFPADVRDQTAQVVNTYVEDAVVAALRTGVSDPKLTQVFAPDAAARLTGPDHAVLTDDGVEKATGSIAASTADVALTALADTGGKLLFVSAALTLDVRAPVAGGTLHVTRFGDLLLAPAGGTWRVAGYDLAVTRDGPGVSPGAASGTAKTGTGA